MQLKRPARQSSSLHPPKSRAVARMPKINPVTTERPSSPDHALRRFQGAARARRNATSDEPTHNPIPMQGHYAGIDPSQRGGRSRGGLGQNAPSSG
jgi:hypothetical protein